MLYSPIFARPVSDLGHGCGFRKKESHDPASQASSLNRTSMSKYDFALDMKSDNSVSQILRHIRPDTEVLEVGCAHGRMTKYLREKLGCRVSIIERDSEPGQAAAAFATGEVLVGPELGDLEKDGWHDHLRKNRQSFDYIIFADILEHLFHPERALKQSIEFLKPEGSIWVSVPNLAHNSVLIELLHDRFDYRDIGLLDSTHVHFFSEQSLLRMVWSCDLRVIRRLDPIQWVSRTEFRNSYERLPWAVAAYLRARKNGEVYQFVWELKRFGLEPPII
jgi:2-polyprenyl-3-methyl-5-hydroxy-6-metoxy-1,4-benzoquinol methylase